VKLTRRTLLFLVVALVLGVLNLWSARDITTVDTLPELAKAVPDSISVLQVSSPIEKLRIERVSTVKDTPDFEKWRILTPLDFPADAAQLRTILRTFATGVPMDAFVDSGNHEDYGVDGQNGLVVELYSPGVDVPVVSVVVGKTAAGPSTFVRIPGSEDVYRADVGGRGRYARPANEWRDKLALDLDRSVVASLTLRRAEDTLTFVRGPSTGDKDGKPVPGPWQFEGSNLAIDDETVELTVRAISHIRAGEIHNPDYEAGFDTPAGVAVLTLTDGTTVEVTLGSRVEKGVAFVRVSGRDEVFRTAANVGRAITQPADAFRDRRLLNFDAKDVSAIAYVDSGLTVVLEQSADGASWAITQPANMDADQRQAQVLVSTLASLRAAAVPEDGGFNPTGTRVEIRFRDGRMSTLELGQSERDAENRPLTRVRSSERPGVFQLKDATLLELKRAFGR
jgi:hypothetical protein